MPLELHQRITLQPLPAEAIYWTSSKTSGKYDSFTHQNMWTYRAQVLKYSKYPIIVIRELIAIMWKEEMGNNV